jgi:hypothetical protein
MTSRVSALVLQLLVEKYGWSVRRVATTLHANEAYVRRVQARKQGLLPSDVEALASALRQTPQRLVLDAMGSRQMTSKQRALYEATRGLIDAAEAPLPKSHPKPRKRISSRTTKAA